MFTGIVTDVGRVRAIRETNRDTRFEIETKFDLSTVDLGASISHAGCCLTVTEKGEGWFAVEVSGETLSKTKLGGWSDGIDGPHALPGGPDVPPDLAGVHAVGAEVLAMSVARRQMIRIRQRPQARESHPRSLVR